LWRPHKQDRIMNDNLNQNRRILIIDDNKAIHEDFKKILGRGVSPAGNLSEVEAALFGETSPRFVMNEFQVDSAFQGQEGLSLIEKSLRENQPYAMAFVDVRMPPGWDGVETAKKILENEPHLQIVICTAHSDYSWEEMTVQLGISDRWVILKKPFDNVEVIQLAHALTEKWSLRQMARAKMGQLETIVAARTHELQTANEQLRVEMAEHARTEETLRQAQKMEAVGQLAGGIAHDFNNLLTVIRGYVDYLSADGNQTNDGLTALREIANAVDRAAKLTSQMLMFSRKKTVQPQDLDLNEVVTRLGSWLHRLLGENISIHIQNGSRPLVVHADPVMMEQILLNLAVNARDAMPEGGQLTIRTDEVEIHEGDCHNDSKTRPGRFVCTSVSDTGCGIAPEILPRIFEPFFTTKQPGKGTGMGLATVYGIVQQHDGWIDVASEPGHGTMFKIFLPANDRKTSAANGSQQKVEIPGGKETILLVEDEEPVRRLARNVLQRYGYRVYAAGSGAEALTIWNERAAEIDLLLTDMVLPGGISGRELARRLHSQKGDLKITYTTGYSKDTVTPDCQLLEGVNFLPKPYSLKLLTNTVRQCLDKSVKT
jgi:two-component system, NtrC family, sensor kinase